jgi:hypothetical protein
VVVVGVVDTKDNPNQVSEGRVHKDRYLHSLVNNRDSHY